MLLWKPLSSPLIHFWTLLICSPFRGTILHSVHESRVTRVTIHLAVWGPGRLRVFDFKKWVSFCLQMRRRLFTGQDSGMTVVNLKSLVRWFVSHCLCLCTHIHIDRIHKTDIQVYSSHVDIYVYREKDRQRGGDDRETSSEHTCCGGERNACLDGCTFISALKWALR